MTRRRYQPSIPLFPLPFSEVKTIFKNPSALSASISYMTSMQRKLLGALINEAQLVISTVKSDEHIFTMHVDDVRTVLGMPWAERKDIIEHLKPLIDVRVEFNYLRKDKQSWMYGSILAGVDYATDASHITFGFNPLIQWHILKPGVYAPIDLRILSALKVERSDALYEMLKDYIDAPQVPKLRIEDFRKLMGITDEQYPIFQDFKKRVLDAIRDEINSKTDIVCSYDLIKFRGKNKYEFIKWTVTRRIPSTKRINDLPKIHSDAPIKPAAIEAKPVDVRKPFVDDLDLDAPIEPEPIKKEADWFREEMLQDLRDAEEQMKNLDV